jgi:hypothetical protein
MCHGLRQCSADVQTALTLTLSQRERGHMAGKYRVIPAESH